MSPIEFLNRSALWPLPGTEPASVPDSEALPPPPARVSPHGAVVGLEDARLLAVAAV